MLVELGWGPDWWTVEEKKTKMYVNEYVLKLTIHPVWIYNIFTVNFGAISNCCFSHLGFVVFFLLREAGLADLEYSQFIKVQLKKKKNNQHSIFQLLSWGKEHAFMLTTW